MSKQATATKRQNDERAAIKCVLRLVDGFLTVQWNRSTLLCNTRGTLMTRGELQDLLRAAARLSVLNRQKAKP